MTSKTMILIVLLLAMGVVYQYKTAVGDVNISIVADYPNARIGDYQVFSRSLIGFTIAKDPVGEESLWFRFRVSSEEPIQPTFVIDDYGRAHQQNWRDVRPAFSKDGIHWQQSESARVETGLLDKLQLRWQRRQPGFVFESPFAAKEFEVAYFVPYDNDALQRWLETVDRNPGTTVSSIGHTDRGKPIPLLTIAEQGAPSEQPEVWIIGREHPGESSASFFVEGLVDAIIQAPALRERLTFKIVPIANLDGVHEGFYYRNAAGIDLSKDWANGSSSEIRAIRAAMMPALKANKVKLVINAHSANSPLSHFTIEASPQELPAQMALAQAELASLLHQVHPHYDAANNIEMWELPGIAGYWFPQNHGVYCLYIENNYSLGGDGTRVTPATLKEFGASLLTVINRFAT